ncbi:MAG TPA: crosslink repair DNA glycosylase YcaQ family protein [Thermoanaerobaculia bacterium]|nr:crosslink repair DNA glycosylase YcaQ family protein [Thermoanaerobaculia bacterium]
MLEPVRLSLDDARRVAVAAQLLARPVAGSVTEVLERAGFVRTLGGVDVYLAVRARRPGFTRGELEAAAAAGEVRVLPAVRGCMYLVPKRDHAICLRVADLLSRARAEREHEKAGIHPGEVEAVAEATVATLAERGALTTEALRRALPEGTVRSLGEAGKKVGISSPLPPALRLLEFAGRIERVHEGARLDHERYLWRIPAASPFAGGDPGDNLAELASALAAVFFRAAGFGSVKSFASWAGLAQRDAKAAVAGLPLVPVTVAGLDEPQWAYPEALDATGANGGPVSFLPFDDNLPGLHGGPALLVDAAHHELEVPVWGSNEKQRLGWARYMSYRGMVADGRVVGFWELDPEARAVVWATFAPPEPGLASRIEAGAADTVRFLLGELGHGKSFSIDSDTDLARRATALRGWDCSGSVSA